MMSKRFSHLLISRAVHLPKGGWLVGSSPNQGWSALPGPQLEHCCAGASEDAALQPCPILLGGAVSSTG